MTGCSHCGFGKDPCLCDLRREAAQPPPATSPLRRLWHRLKEIARA